MKVAVRRRVRRRVVGVVIVLVLGGDASAVVARWGGTEAAGPPARSVPSTTAASSTAPDLVLFRERFDPGTAYAVGEGEPVASSVVDGEYHLRFSKAIQEYVPTPPARPERAVVAATRDVLVEVDGRSASRDPTDWFGPMCRFGGINSDVYFAQVRPDGSWRLVRTTLAGAGSDLKYVWHVLAEGKAAGSPGNSQCRRRSTSRCSAGATRRRRWSCGSTASTPVRRRTRPGSGRAMRAS